MAGGPQLFEGAHLTGGNTRFCSESSKCHNYLLFVGQNIKYARRIIFGFGSNVPPSNQESGSNVSPSNKESGSNVPLKILEIEVKLTQFMHFCRQFSFVAITLFLGGHFWPKHGDLGH